jgi:hypothetical protein
MLHGIIGRNSAGEDRGARVRRARIAWLALGAISLAAGCGGETTGTTGAGSAGSGTGGGSSTGGGPAAQCSVGVRDVLVSDVAGTSPTVAFAGDHYLVVWTSTAKDAGDIRMALLDAKGAKVTEQAVAEGAGESAFPSVVAEAGGGFLVVWQDKSASGAVVNGRRVDAQGMPKGAAFQIAASTSAEARPNAAPTTGGAAVAWTDATTSTIGMLTGEMITSKTPIDQGTAPTIGGSGANLGATWVAGSKVGASAMTSPGAPLTPVMFRNAVGKANAPRVAVHDDGTLTVVWEDNRAGDGNETVYLTRIDKSAQAGMEKRLPMSPTSANYPDVAWTGSHEVIVYYQFRDGPPAIYLSLIAPDLASSGQDLKISGEGMPARYPRITRTGDANGTLGVVYAEKDGPIRASLIACP